MEELGLRLKGFLPKGSYVHYMVECRVSIIGITIMVWASIPHIGTALRVPAGLHKGNTSFKGVPQGFLQEFLCRVP